MTWAFRIRLPTGFGMSVDLRRPQDYFQRLWSTAFRASDLAQTNTDDQDDCKNDDEGRAA
ncbi:hypothetical protein SZN_30442 [Streptomyces zinciresistens K42]|uniref:Uncharacterized protein n=1 Tax=Streptomyces zinciresistens K42 TaxID=700597 RepID=G2GKP5_9ACTN|nr:hypothetical protein SZN_30442 [Streptomyces zinciresistens K42]